MMGNIAGIKFIQEGEGEVPILCLHGIGGNGSYFSEQISGLESSNKIIACDIPGYGGSPLLEETTFENLSIQFLKFMDTMGMERAHIMGQSFGGMIAIDFAIRFPERVASLILVGTSPSFGGRDASFKEAFLAARLKPLDEGMTMPELAVKFVPQIVGAEATGAMKAAAVAMMSAVSPDTYRAILACLISFNRRDDIGKIECPVCVISGSEDNNAPSKTMQKMAENLPDSEYHDIQNAGHLLNLEKPEEFNAIVQKFLKKIRGT